MHAIAPHHQSACHLAEALPPAGATEAAHAAPELAARRLALYAERRALARAALG